MSFLGFSRDLIPLLRCSADGGQLVVSEGSGQSAISSTILTCQACGNRYAIRDGILEADELTEDPDSVMVTERDVRDHDASDYDSFTDQPWYRMEIPSTVAELPDLNGRYVVEFGSGTGRFTTRLLDRRANVLAVDFSRESHRVLQQKLNGSAPIGLVRGDVTKVRLRPEAFDLAFSAQLYQHIPTRESRRAFLERIRSCLKPGGCILLTAYYQDLRRRLTGRAREGFHDSGIFFHRFTEDELRDEISDYFHIVSIRPFLYHVPIIWRLETRFALIESLCRKYKVLREFGSLIMVKAEKRA